MPTYDYRCPNGHDFEHFYRKISDSTAELACPSCGAVAARRVSGGAGLVFKGSGFYLTDYGKNAHRKSGSDAAGAPKGESAGDSKPAAAESTKAEGGSATAKSGDSAGGSSKAEPAKAAEPKSSSTKPKRGDDK